MFLKKILLVFISVAGCNFTFAQTDLYPVPFGLSGETIRVYNPVLANTSSVLSAELGNQFYTGVFSKFENHYFIASYNVTGKDSTRNRNNVGLKIWNEKEGDFIARPRYYLSYSWATKISDRFYLGAGTNIGLAGYIFKSTNISAGGSSSKPDGDFAIALFSANWKLGIAVNQIFNSVVTPKEYQFKSRRFYIIYAEKSIDLTELHSFLFYTSSFIYSQKENAYNLGSSLFLYKRVMFGFNYYLKERISFMAAFKNLSYERNAFDLIFCYNIQDSKSSQVAPSSFELLLSYRFLR